jgi:hypothetical protein
VEWDDDGNILLSCRNFNEITKINRQNGAIIWRLGGKKNQFNFTNDPVGFNGQHDIRRIDNGNITLFDNGRYHTPAMAWALEYMLNETTKTATLVWEYVYDSTKYSTSLGNFQTLENTNRLIDFGTVDGDFPWLVMVKSDKSKILEIDCPEWYVSYRAFNYSTLPWQLPQPFVDCYSSGSGYILEAEPGHAEYLWSTGATTRSIPVIHAGIYWVFVPLNDGYISSGRIVVTDPSNPCLYLGNEEEDIPEESVSLTCIPNPASIHTEIHFTLAQKLPVAVSLHDPAGKTVFNPGPKIHEPGKHILSLDVSDIPAGLHILRFVAGDLVSSEKLIVL